MTTIDINTIIDISIMNASKVQREYYTGFMNEKVVVFIYDIDNTVEAVINSQEIVNVNDINSNNENSESKQEDFGIMELYECNMKYEDIMDSNVNNEDIMDKSNDEIGEEEIFHYSLVEHDLKFIPVDVSGDLIDWSNLEQRQTRKPVSKWVKQSNGCDIKTEVETDLPSIQRHLFWFDVDESTGETMTYPVIREVERIEKDNGFFKVFYKGQNLPEIHPIGKLGRTIGLVVKENGEKVKVEGAAVTLGGWLLNGILLKSAKDGSSTFGKIHTNSKGVKTIEYGKSTGATPSEEFENYDISIIRAWLAQSLCKEIVDENGFSIGYEFKNVSYKSIFDGIVKATEGFCTAATFDWQWADEVEELIINCIESQYDKVQKKAIERMTKAGVPNSMIKKVFALVENLVNSDINMETLEDVNNAIKDFVKGSTKTSGNMWAKARISFVEWKNRAAMFSSIIWELYSIEKLLVEEIEMIADKDLKPVEVRTWKQAFFWSMARNYVSRMFRKAQQQAWSDCQSPDRVVEHEFALASAKRLRREQGKRVVEWIDMVHFGDIVMDDHKKIVVITIKHDNIENPALVSWKEVESFEVINKE